MDMLIRALTKSVGDENLFTDCRDAAIIPSESNFLVSAQINGRPCEWKSEKIILCTGSRGLDKLLPFISPGDMKGLSSLEYAKVIQVAAGFSLWKGMQLNAYGGLIPYREKSRILGILFPSSIFTRRAPTGGALLSVFLGGFRNPGMLNLTDSEIEEIVLAEIETMLQLKDPKPDLLSIHRYTAAIPQYGRTSETRIGEIKRIEKRFPGLVLASNIRDGIGMADRIRQAKTIADQLAEK
jgi:oxygen-dependent protoporphyrinogen oxidase